LAGITLGDEVCLIRIYPINILEVLVPIARHRIIALNISRRSGLLFFDLAYLRLLDQ